MAQTVLRGKKVSMSEAAEFFGVVGRTIREWTEMGCPYLKRGGRGETWEFDTAAVVAWRIEVELSRRGVGSAKGTDRTSLSHRKSQAETEIKEVDLARKAGQLLPIGWFLEVLGYTLDACNGKLQAVANRVAPLVAVESDVQRCHRIVEKAIDEARRELVAPEEQALISAAISGVGVRRAIGTVQAGSGTDSE